MPFSKTAILYELYSKTKYWVLLKSNKNKETLPLSHEQDFSLYCMKMSELYARRKTEQAKR